MRLIMNQYTMIGRCKSSCCPSIATIKCIVTTETLRGGNLPQQLVDIPPLPPPYCHRLADPAFHRPAPVRMLLGADVWARCLQEEILRGGDDLVLQSTRLGWLVFGKAPIRDQQMVASIMESTLPADVDQQLLQTLQSFLESESLPQDSSAQTQEQAQCEAHFESTHRFLPEHGRYEVELPLLQLQPGDGHATATSAGEAFRQGPGAAGKIYRSHV